MAELQSLDINLLLLSHSSLAMITAALSVSPAWNVPLALYGLVVVANERNGDAIRQFAALLAGSFILDLFWLLSSWRAEASSLAILLILLNAVLKPVTLLVTLGNLRARGEPTFSLPGNFSIPGSFPGNSNSGGFPPASHTSQPSQTVWSAPAYHGFEDETAAPPPPPGKSSKKESQQVAPTSGGTEGSGYHSLE